MKTIMRASSTPRDMGTVRISWEGVGSGGFYLSTKKMYHAKNYSSTQATIIWRENTHTYETKKSKHEKKSSKNNNKSSENNNDTNTTNTTSHTKTPIATAMGGGNSRHSTSNDGAREGEEGSMGRG